MDLEKCQLELLDLGKGNKFINFKDTKYTTLELKQKVFYNLFDRVVNGNETEFVFVDKQIKKEIEKIEIELKEENEKNSYLVTSEKEVEKSNKKEEESGPNLKEQQKNYQENEQKVDEINLISEQKIKKIKNKILDEALKNLNDNQVLAYKENVEADKVVEKLHKRSIELIMEKGINAFYISFGFLRWKEVDYSSDYLNSPLLLIPIKIIIKGANKPPKFVEYEDEIITNPSLLCKIENDFNLKIPVYDEKSYGSVKEYFEKLETIIENFNWSISKKVKIGMFPFLKMDMYHDVKNNKSKILSNKNINIILGNDDEPSYDSRQEENQSDKIDTILLHNVYDADSSQLEAIKKALTGETFVIQGPPGTGKSQTITNIIAELLANNKKILFVSEKLAALQVVERKLEEAGLGDFCLELHSNKSNKKEVIKELDRVAKKEKKGLSHRIESEMKKLSETRYELNKYAQHVHKQYKIINKSPFEMYGIVESLKKYKNIEIPIENIDEKGESYLDNCLNIFDRYSKYVPSIGYDYRNNPWYGYIDPDSSYKNRFTIKKELEKIFEAVKKLKNTISDFSSDFNLTNITIDSLKNVKDLALFISKAHLYNLIFGKNYKKDNLSYLKEMKEITEKIIKSKEDLLTIFEEDFLKINGSEYYEKYIKEYDTFFKFLNNSYRKDNKKVKSYLKSKNKKINFKKIIDYLKTLREVQEKEEELRNNEEKLINILGDYYNKLKTDWKGIIFECENTNEFLEKGFDFSYFVNTKEKDFNLRRDKYLSLSNDLGEIFEIYKEVFQNFNNRFDENLFDIYKEELNSLEIKIDGCIKSHDRLENWIRFNKLLNDAKEMKLKEFIDISIKKKTNENNLKPMFTKLFYRQWIDYVFQNDPVLGDFKRINHDNILKLFIEKDKGVFEISKAKIYSKLSNERPNHNFITQGSELSILKRENEKKRRQMSVRELLKKTSNLVQTLKPCFLMSPLSISSYLDPNSIKFDTVIFDEASQILPWDALVAIYRADQVIMVGDNRQMPPTTFFSASGLSSYMDEEFDENNINDFESILDICSASYDGFDLKWHYRSRTEDLISFSNTNFYDDRLITFPSALVERKNFGVEFIYLKNGEYYNRRNRVEAIEICELIFRHFKENPKRSLGIVAFSQAQQSEIEDQLSKYRETRKEYDSFFDLDKTEPFFVKNLENVQGDERDTIIFSICYAQDKNGKLSHNFGPLNKKGGERRLNVAITRAKYNVKVVSSIRWNDIDLSRTKSKGAKLLKNYLEYSEKGINYSSKETENNKFNEAESLFEEQVAELIKDAGYSYDMQVGCSGYRIDIGVKHPEKCDYVLAVECDGATYHSSKEARDRDRLRQEVLERQGWKFYRIWSTDWFKNRKIEEERLLKHIRNAIDQYKDDFVLYTEDNYDANYKKTNTSNVSDVILDYDIKEKSIEDLFEKYQGANVVSLSYTCKDFNDVIVKIVQIEGPIHKDILLKKMIPLITNAERATKKVRKWFDDIIENIYILRIDNDFIYVDGQREKNLRIPKNNENKRSIKNIYTKEIANGMYEILKQSNNKMTREGLKKFVKELLKFKRTSDAIDTKLDQALDYLIYNDLVKVENDNVVLNKMLKK